MSHNIAFNKLRCPHCSCEFTIKCVQQVEVNDKLPLDMPNQMMSQQTAAEFSFQAQVTIGPQTRIVNANQCCVEDWSSRDWMNRLPMTGQADSPVSLWRDEEIARAIKEGSDALKNRASRVWDAAGGQHLQGVPGLPKEIKTPSFESEADQAVEDDALSGCEFRRRTVAEVQAMRADSRGCCQKFANHEMCDCLEQTVEGQCDHKWSVSMHEGKIRLVCSVCNYVQERVVD